MLTYRPVIHASRKFLELIINSDKRFCPAAHSEASVARWCDNVTVGLQGPNCN